MLAVFSDPSQDVLVATDFDGTLSPMVDDPAAARPIDGADEALTALAATSTEVAIISGRPVDFLASLFPVGVTLIGLYGLETLRDGERVDFENSGVWREVITDVANAARRNGPKGIRVEPKDLSITLHYREHPEIADAVIEYAAVAAAGAGLRDRPARMSVELHPPIDVDKGTALAELARDHDGPVVFIGDDHGDIPAFDMLDELASAGRPVLRVAVQSTEMPDDLRKRADLLVDGPAGVVELLRQLRHPAARS